MTTVTEPATQTPVERRRRRPLRVPGQGILLANVALVLVGLLVLDVQIFSQASLSTLTCDLGRTPSAAGSYVWADVQLEFGPVATPFEGRTIAVELYRRETLTARRRLIGGFYAYDNQARTTKLSDTCNVTTDKLGLAQCSLDPGVSGEV